MEKQPVEILIEPVFRSKNRTIRFLKKIYYGTKWPIAEKKALLFIKIELLSPDRIKGLLYHHVTIRARGNNYELDFDLKIDLKEMRKNIATYSSPPAMVSFPFSGFFWIEVLGDDSNIQYAVKHRIRQFSGNLETSCSYVGSHPGCTIPIIVHDISTLRMVRLTRILVFMTIILAIDAIPRIIQLINSIFK